MCSTLYKKYGQVIDKIARRFKSLQKICRVIALLDAILGLIILIILLIRRVKYARNDGSDSGVSSSVLLGLQAFEIVFALVQYEGVRRGILCMIRTWFLYCAIRFLILASAAAGILASNSKLRLWMFGVEGTFTLFHLTQCVFLLALHRTKLVDVGTRTRSTRGTSESKGESSNRRTAVGCGRLSENENIVVTVTQR